MVDYELITHYSLEQQLTSPETLCSTEKSQKMCSEEEKYI